MPFLKISSSLTFFYLVPSCPDHQNPYLDPNRPTVLLLHPRLFDSYFFTPQWRDARLARAYNLLAIDHHYHGKTKANMDDKPYDFVMIAKDLLKALDKLGVKKCHIFGNSLGAPIGIRMYMHRPELVESMILCGKHPPTETEENKEQYRELLEACLEVSPDGTDKLDGAVIHGLHYIYFGDHTSADAIIDEWVETSDFKPSNPRLIRKIFSSLLDRVPIDAQKLAKTVTCPVLIIHGAEDVPYPPENAYELYEALPNATRDIYIVPGAPHFLSWTHATEVNDATVKFLDSVTGIDSEAIASMPLPPKYPTPAESSMGLTKKKSFWQKIAT